MLIKIILSISLSLLFTNSFAQTCNNSITPSTPTERFNIQGNGTVFDTQTKLIWKRCSEGQIWDATSCTGSATEYTFWQDSLQAVQALNASGGYAGAADWRVPNIKELASIIELKCTNPAINLTIFPDTSSSMPAISSSQYDSDVFLVWFVYFDSGLVISDDKVYSEKRVRLVRSGQ